MPIACSVSIVLVKIKEKRVEAKGEVLDYSSWMKKGEGVLGLWPVLVSIVAVKIRKKDSI